MKLTFTTGLATLISGSILSLSANAAMPKYDHVVVVLLENKKDTQIIGSSSAPYINSLAAQGANFAQAYAVTHPSQPNYIALFSGDTQGVTSDACPNSFGNTANLGASLLAAGYSFAGYSESMPSDGYTGCKSGNYARKHNPWVNFSNVPASSNLMFTRFPGDFSKLPTLSFVVPDLCSDMHDCSISTGDTWVRNNLDAYAQWAKTHNSLLIVTFDEDDSSGTANRIPMIWVGAGIAPSVNYSRVDHYGVLRTLLDMYGLTPFARAVNAVPVSDIWAGSASPAPTATPKPSATPLVTATPKPTVGPVATATPSAKPSATPTIKPTATPVAGSCYAAWSASQIYATAGNKVSFGKHNWQNKWWTTGEQPSPSASVWADLGVCN
ncbi:acid phosphatase [Chitinibacter bivalviorum]|uniref:Acid phosphatase n=1 Tax=Chitinibacter bivalviorum TaxID=2739434 RepID=A0A7H9BKG3_9NEIS|nr:alkaline phosphatase family protein [Chitinibacter bivalviorum]QLG88979.1 acid phosphatase [Chitinibacter bivalviorum]